MRENYKLAKYAKLFKELLQNSEPSFCKILHLNAALTKDFPLLFHHFGGFTLMKKLVISKTSLSSHKIPVLYGFAK